MGDYSGYPPPTKYPPPAQYPPQQYPPPSQQGGDLLSTLMQYSPAHMVGSLLRFLVPGVDPVMNDIGNIQALRRAGTIASYAHLAQDPAFNAMQYGQWPAGIPADPWPTVQAPPGSTLPPADQQRLGSFGTTPPDFLSGYHPTNLPGPGMPPRVLTSYDADTALKQAQADAWRRYNQGTGPSDVPPYFPPVIGTPGHYQFLQTTRRDAKGAWLPMYSSTPPLRPQTGQVAPPPPPFSHGGPPINQPAGTGGGPPPPPPPAGAGARAAGGRGQQLVVGQPLRSGETIPPFTDMETGEQVAGGLAGTDGMSIRGFNRKDYVRDPTTGQVYPAPNQGVGTGGQQANNGPTATTTVPTTTTTSTTARVISPTTTQPPRSLTTTTTPPTTTTLPPTAGGAVAGSGAQPGAASAPPAAPPAAAPGGPGGVSPDMQRLDAIKAPWETTGTTAPPTTGTTQTPTTTAPPTTAPPTPTTTAPTTTAPPPTTAPAPTTTTEPPTVFPLGPGSHPGGYPSPAFQPPGEAAGAALGRVLGQTPGTAPGAETAAAPSMVARIAGALAPAEAQAGGPPGGPGGQPASTAEPADVPEPTPPEPTSELQPSQQMRSDIGQAIAMNTNGLQYYLHKQYGKDYPNPNDIPSAILLADGVVANAGQEVARARAIDMARARAQSTPEERAKIDAANTAYNRLYTLYLSPIGDSNRKGLDASIPTPTGPGLDRLYTETGPFFKEWAEGKGPASWIGTALHAGTRSGAGLPNAPPSMESVQQMSGRGGIPGIAATQFLQGHLVAIPIARALGASGRVNQRELSLIQQYLIPSTETTYESNYQKLQNTLQTLDAIRRGYKVDEGRTGMTLMTGEDGQPHLVELGGGSAPPENQPNIAIHGPLGGGQPAPPQDRLIGR